MVAEPETLSELGVLLQFLQRCPVGIAKLSGTGRVEMMNPKANQLLLPVACGASLDNLLVVLEPYAPELRKLVTAFEPTHGLVCENHEVEIPGLKGPRRSGVLAVTIIKVDPVCLMMVLIDISRLVEQERMIRTREERLRAFFDGTPDSAIYTLDRDGQIDAWNQSAQRVEGYLPSEAVGLPFGFDYPADEKTAAAVALRLTMATKTGWHEDEGWRVRRDGSRFWANTIVSALQDDGTSEISGYSVITRDITERKKAEDSLRSMAVTDFLTGAFNRRYFLEQAEQEAAVALATDSPLAFLILDADQFKRINDTFGHPVGDAVLKEVTATCQRCLRPIDLLARYGGEEFVIMLRQTPLPTTMTMAESLRQALSQVTVRSGSDVVKFTVSLSVAQFHGSVQQSLQQADDALYAAKQRGRNCVVALAAS